MKVYIINLAHRNDRWMNMQQQFERIVKANECEIIRVDAVNGRELYANFESIGGDNSVFSLYLQYKMRAATHPLTPDDNDSHFFIQSAGAIGCTLSHVKALKSFLETNEEYAIICEDDVIVHPCLDIPLQKQRFAESGKDLLHLHNGIPLPQAFLCGTDAYMVNRRGAQIIIDNALPIEIHYDAFLHTLESLQKINVVRVRKNLIWQKDLNSDIHNGEIVWKKWLSNTCISFLVIMLMLMITLIFCDSQKLYLWFSALFSVIIFGTLAFPFGFVTNSIQRCFH